jgi:hypothetical protein
MNNKRNSCLICKSNTFYYFSKTYPTFTGSPFKDELKVDYYRCEECGFVLSETHKEMDKKQWEELNTSWHHHFTQNRNASISNPPPYLDQAVALMLLSENGAINIESALDYAAGYGTMENILKKYFNKHIN